MKIRTKSIEQLKEEFEWKPSGRCINFKEFGLLIPSDMFYIMGEIIEVEEINITIDWNNVVPGYHYKDDDHWWQLCKEWTMPMIDEEIDSLFKDLLEGL